MRLHVFPDYFYIQPSQGCVGNTLRLGRNSKSNKSDILVIKDLTLDTSLAHSSFIYGIVGAITIYNDYLIVITDCETVANINEADIYKVKKVRILPFSPTNQNCNTKEALRDERYMLKLLDELLHTKSFFFSYDYYITLSLQKISQIENEKKHRWENTDIRFFWNHFLLARFIDCGLSDDFILPLMDGAVITKTFNIRDNTCQICLISRRSCFNAGLRFTRRGCDSGGNVANFAETEQLLIIKSANQPNKPNNVFSFVQTRGSIPLYWEQLVNLKYAPKPKITGTDEENSTVFAFHFSEQQKQYGKRQILIDLVNQKGSELLLEKAYSEQVHATHLENLRYIGFDFHYECRAMKWHNLKKLMNDIMNEFPKMKYFQSQNTENNLYKSKQTQNGVFRTNCMDCLDRTNVVQSMISEQQIMNFFEENKVDLNDIKNSDFSYIFKNMWADNADILSIQYSGTPALKTDFTRTGKRTIVGALYDGKHSLQRYYLNNFCDGTNQDAIDLFLGKFHLDSAEGMKKVYTSPFKDQNDHPIYRLMKIFSLFALILFILLSIFFALFYPQIFKVPYKLLLILFFILVFLIFRFFVLFKGRKYVNIPSKIY